MVGQERGGDGLGASCLGRGQREVAPFPLGLDACSPCLLGDHSSPVSSAPPGFLHLQLPLSPLRD